MADVSLQDVKDRVASFESLDELVEAASVIANALSIGCGAMIPGSLMETELRRALCLQRGEMVVTIPRR